MRSEGGGEVRKNLKKVWVLRTRHQVHVRVGGGVEHHALDGHARGDGVDALFRTKKKESRFVHHTRSRRRIAPWGTTRRCRSARTRGWPPGDTRRA